VARALDDWGYERDWIGPDPYEGLNATRFVAPFRRSPMGRRLLTQLVKRSAVNLRPLLGVSPTANPAAIAHVIQAYALDGFLEPGVAVARLEEQVGRLERLRSPGFEELAWGYPFDVQTRALFYPRGSPNTIATAFAGLGLLDAHERAGLEQALPMAGSAGDFFLRHVPQTPASAGAYFGYLPGDRSPIHNANMLVCAFLARLSRHVDSQAMRDAVAAGVEYTVELQRPDGSWPYGETPGLGWIDNFHTGYVLDCLMVCGDAGLGEGIDEAVERGLAYYERELFLPDGTPKYMHDAVYPVDIQCAAQAIQTFSLASARGRPHMDAARRSYDYAVGRLRKPDGAFVFQRRRFWTNRISLVRWGAAPMLAALATLIDAENKTEPAP
jgi:hypothetical protein